MTGDKYYMCGGGDLNEGDLGCGVLQTIDSIIAANGKCENCMMCDTFTVLIEQEETVKGHELIQQVRNK